MLEMVDFKGAFRKSEIISAFILSAVSPYTNFGCEM